MEPKVVAKKKSEVRKHSAMIRISEEAREKADRAARVLGVSLADYVSDVLIRVAPKDTVAGAKRLAEKEAGK
jgi:uncharacterized protein (DUF1778 family)